MINLISRLTKLKHCSSNQFHMESHHITELHPLMFNAYNMLHNFTVFQPCSIYSLLYYMHKAQVPVQASQNDDTMYHSFSTTTTTISIWLCIKWDFQNKFTIDTMGTVTCELTIMDTWTSVQHVTSQKVLIVILDVARCQGHFAPLTPLDILLKHNKPLRLGNS